MDNTPNRLQSTTDEHTLTTEESTAKDGEEKFIENERNTFHEISKRLPCDKFHMLGKTLGLETNVIIRLDRECNIYNQGEQFKIIRMLEKWKSKSNPDEGRLVSSLVKALRKIECNDIADRIEKGKLIGHYQESWQLLDGRFSISKMKRYDFGILFETRIIPYVFKFHSAIQKELEKNLPKKKFRIQLPTFAWLRKKVLPLDKLFVELSMKSKDKWGNEQEKLIDEEKIFIEGDKNIPRRILIEGHPGYGKTTLLRKFLSDWSLGEKYICTRFDLVFEIPLRNYGVNLSEHLLQWCAKVKGSPQEKLKAIKEFEEKVLILLDGLDEIPTGATKTLLPLLKGEEHPNMTIVVTCRTGFAQLETESDQTLGNRNISNSVDLCIWDKRVQIKGISHEKREEFLQKYLNVDEKELRETVSQMNLELNDLYQCPLFLLLLASLIEEKSTRPVITKTDLYKRIINFVINRSLEKLKGQKKEFDVFESDKFGCQKLLINFGKLCLEKIKSQSFIFEENELKLKCSGENGDEALILKLGFLSKETSFFNHEEKEYYEPIHKSFLEFLAAFFIYSLDEDHFKREIQELLLKCNIWPKEDQLLYPFLGGFLQSNAFKLFNAFSPYNGIISIFKDDKNYLYNVQNILLEIPLSEEIINSLENLSIGNWQRVKYEESFHKWFVGLLEYSKKRRDVSLLIPKYLYIFNDLSHDVKINTIQVNISKNEKFFKVNFRNVQCENLIITFEDGIYEDSKKILKEIIKIKAVKTWLNVSYPLFQKNSDSNTRDNFINLFTKLNKGKKFQNINFFYLSLNDFPLSFFSSISTSIQELIKNQKIHYGVNIQLSEEIENHLNDLFRKEFADFERIVCNSQIKSFGVDIPFLKNPMSFPEVFYKDEKEMQFIGMRGSFEGIKMDEVKFSAEQFYCIEFKLEQKSFISDLLSKIKNSKRLACEGDLISDLCSCDFISEWKGLETIQRLDLDVGTVQDKDSFLTGISWFNNLQEINLIGLKKHKLLIEVISRLPFLKRICYSSESNFLKKFLKRLLNLQDEKKEKFNFDELEVKLKTDDSSNFLSNKTFIERVEMCFVKHVFNKFSIIHGSTLHIENLLKYFISNNKFKISSQWIEEPRYHGISDLVHSKLNLDEIPQLKHRQSIYVENEETV